MKPQITEHENEPVTGLPARLPAGEQIVWQGVPRWTAIAVHAFHVRALGVYFAALLGARATWLVSTGLPLPRVLLGCIGPLLVASLAIGIMCGIAWLAARTTIYTVTNRRVVIRSGIALQTTVNLPFRAIDGAALKVRGDGSGDLVLQMNREQRVGWAVLWPHVRPWQYKYPQPMFRGIPDVGRVGELLTRQFASAAQAGDYVQAPPARTPVTHAAPGTPATA